MGGSQVPQRAAEAVCRQAYADTAVFYAKEMHKLGSSAFGYKILYGPPIVETPCLILGRQPSGGLADAVEGCQARERTGWPPINEYSRAQYAFAAAVREIWGKDQLDRFVGINMNFFRALGDAWSRLPRLWRNHSMTFAPHECARLCSF